MVSKVQERIYAEAAASLLMTHWHLVDIPEPPDFEVQVGQEKFGLEVRQIFVGAESSFGSLAKKNESENSRTIADFAKRYYECGGAPVLAKFLGAVSMVETRAFVSSMIAAAPKRPSSSARLEVQGVMVFMTSLPTAWSNYSRWILVDDKVGFAKRATSADLQRAVDQKQSRLPLYTDKYKHTDLLLVADRLFNSGRLLDGDDLAVTNPGFRTIYFMSYPECIRRVG